MGFNVATMLTETAHARPDRIAVIAGDHYMSYGELHALSDRFAAGLHARGINAGDAVALQLPNLPQFVIAYFGMLKAGAVIVPMNPLYKAREIAHALRDSDARMLVTWAGFIEEAAKGAADAGVTDLVVLTTPGVPQPTAGRPFEQLLDNTDPAPFHQSDPGDAAVIIYTSGTTGVPKGAELSHFAMFMNADTCGRLMAIDDRDVVLAVLPLFHIFALSDVLGLAVRYGAALPLVPRFDPAAVLDVVERDRVTVFEGVPTMYVALLAQPDFERRDLSALRLCVSGGAPLPAEVIDEFERRFDGVILEGYGLSETASASTFNVSAADRRVYSVGKPLWGVDVEIRDAQDQPLPRGHDHIGELVIRGVNIMRGYHNNPRATNEAIINGWFHTGDLGYQDEDGYFFIVDRKKNSSSAAATTSTPAKSKTSSTATPPSPKPPSSASPTPASARKSRPTSPSAPQNRHRRRTHHPHQRTLGLLQIPPLHRIPRQPPEGRHRKDRETRPVSGGPSRRRRGCSD